jgi:hypothetical protein
MYKLIQHLTLTCRKLEEDVTKLKAQVGSQQRKTIINYLNNQPIPNTVYETWIKSFHVSLNHLEEVFNPFQCLADGMKKCIADRFANEQHNTIPLRSFHEKNGVLYIYSMEQNDTTNTATCCWKIATTEHWSKLINALALEFMRKFLEWEEEHQEEIESSAMEKNKQIMYMVKLTKPNALKEKTKQELRVWLYNIIKQNRL